jgi:hypothetical protein
MIEHHPWVGPLYSTDGIAGQRLGIVGYSAWTPDDHEDYTVISVTNVVSGAWPNVQFFNAIAGYFQMEVADFYNRVLLFEFVPCAVGGKEKTYAVATPAQAEAGRERLLRLSREYAVDKLLVFSKKAWASMPPTEESSVGKLPRLGETNFDYGHYQIGDHRVTAVGLRHPQYAPRKTMRAAVESVLALP